MDDQPVGSFEYSGLKAEVYSSNLPGEFRIVFRDASGNTLEETPLTGVSTYRQRETEIMERLRQLSEGKDTAPSPDLTSAGEY